MHPARVHGSRRRTGDHEMKWAGAGAGAPFTKRVLDLAGAVGGIVLLWPIALLIAIAIRLDTRGPALFVQSRIGQDERVFPCFKFRSMHVDVPERPTHESTQTDITRVGAFLRWTKLDELPQLVNVLVGDMSLVGPRPCLPTQGVLIAARRRLGVFRVRPGMTGLAQLNGIDMSQPELLAEIDARYVVEAGTLLDLRLILATLPGGAKFRPKIDRTR